MVFSFVFDKEIITQSKVGEKVDNKEFIEKTEEFAKRIIILAKEDGLTVRQLCMATDTAKVIAYNSMVDSESIEKTDYPSQHIVDYPNDQLFCS